MKMQLLFLDKQKIQEKKSLKIFIQQMTKDWTANDAEANHPVINSPSHCARPANSCAIDIVAQLG